ncbi:MAG: hypothetical protein ABH830_01070 [Patescibacteria group bacterium]
MKKEITNKEILQAVNAFSNETDKRFSSIDTRFSSIDTRFNNIDIDLTKIKATMVTKDYLDEKLSDLRGDLVVLMRKEDVKVKRLVEILQKRKVLTNKEVKEIMSMEPFPQLSL